MDPWKPKGYVCRSFDWENSIVSFNEAPRFDKLKQGNTRVLSSPLDLFLDLSVDSPRHSYEAPEIYASCSEHITNLQHDGEGAPGSLAVWMDDRSKSRGPRNYNGPMTIKDWLERLKLKVRRRGFDYSAVPCISDHEIETRPRRPPRRRDKTNVTTPPSIRIGETLTCNPGTYRTQMHGR